MKLGVRAGGEVGSDVFAGFGEIGEGEVFELDAEEVGGGVGVGLDAVALSDAGSDAERSGVCGWAVRRDGVGAFVDDVYFAGVVEIDVERGDGGMVVHGDELVCAVVDVHDEEVGVFEDGFVVGWEEGWARVLLRGCD